MKYKLVYSRGARVDLDELFDHISAESGVARASAYVRRITAFCRRLEAFPERGTRREDLWPGLRLIGFEGRVAIAFQVSSPEVRILRVLYGGRDLRPGLFKED